MVEKINASSQVATTFAGLDVKPVESFASSESILNEMGISRVTKGGPNPRAFGVSSSETPTWVGPNGTTNRGIPVNINGKSSPKGVPESARKSLKGKLRALKVASNVATAALIVQGLLQLNEFAKHPEKVIEGIDAAVDLANLSSEQKKQVVQQLVLDLKNKTKESWKNVQEAASAAVELYNLPPKEKKELGIALMADTKDKLSSMGERITKETKGFVKDVVAFFGLPKDVKKTIGKQFLQDAGNIYRDKTAQVLGSAGKILSHLVKRIDGK